MSTTPLQIRMDDNTVERLDALVEPIRDFKSQDPFQDRMVLAKFSRSSVARLAIGLGLKELEARFLGKGKPVEKSATTKSPEPAPITGAQFKAWKDAMTAEAKSKGRKFTWPMVEELTGIKRGTMTAWKDDPEFIIPFDHQAALRKAMEF